MKEKKEASRVRSKNFLKAHVRLPFQTTEFLYKAINVAEEQVEELLSEVDVLRKENRRLNLLNNSRKNKRYE